MITSLDNTETEHRVGSCLGGQYQIIEHLGAGGMGAVYKAHNTALGTTVALKLVREADPKIIARMVQEAKVLAAMDHPNIVKVNAFVHDTGAECFMVAEFLDGVDLASIISTEGPLASERACHLIAQAADGLAHAHSRGITHRDVKPSNIMILSNGPGKETVKVVDFGIARIDSSAGVLSQKLTGTGAVLGTPNYMSPEQCMGTAVDPRSDIYSLGCVLYECLTGTVAVGGESAFEVMYNHVHKHVPTLEAPELQLLASIIHKATSVDPADRFQTMDDFAIALRERREQKLGKRPRSINVGPRKLAPLLMAAVVATVVVAVLTASVHWPQPQTTHTNNVPSIGFGQAVHAFKQTVPDDEKSIAQDPPDEIFAALEYYVAHPGARISAEDTKDVAELYRRADDRLHTTKYLKAEINALQSAAILFHKAHGQCSPARDQTIRLLEIFTGLDSPEQCQKTIDAEASAVHDPATRKKFENVYEYELVKTDGGPAHAPFVHRILARLYADGGEKQMAQKTLSLYNREIAEPAFAQWFHDQRQRFRNSVGAENSWAQPMGAEDTSAH